MKTMQHITSVYINFINMLYVINHERKTNPFSFNSRCRHDCLPLSDKGLQLLPGYFSAVCAPGTATALPATVLQRGAHSAAEPVLLG